MSFIGWVKGFFGQESSRDFSNMNSSQKKIFLSNDLIERMIRVEQRVSSSFGKPVYYKQTRFYGNLKDYEQKRFEKYLKTKKVKPWILSFIGVGAMMFSFSMTGNVISGEGNVLFSWAGLILAILILIGLGFSLYGRNKRVNSQKRIHRLIDKSLRKKAV